MASQERDPRAYELMTVFVPELSEEDNQAEIEKIEGFITAAGGSITETLITSPWGRRRLAYTIHFNGVDYRDGFYTVFHFDAQPSALAGVEREMKLDNNVMRYLLVHHDPKAGEKFQESDEDESASEDAGEATTAETSASAPAAETTQESAPATSAPAEETAQDSTPAASAPAEETTQPAPAETPAETAAEAAPVDDAPETTTQTAPPATNDPASDDTADKE